MIDASENWGRLEDCPARVRLADGGGRNDRCYVILEGVLVQEKVSPRGGRQIVQTHVPGDVCGFSALSGDPMSADIVALSPVSYLSVSSHWLASLTNESFEWRLAVWREMSREAAISAAWIANNAQRPAYQRIAHLICELEARLRPPGGRDDVAFDWWGTQSDVKDVTGLSLVHVNKTLRKLEADGLISYRRSIAVHDLTKLTAVAGFDPAYLALDRKRLGDMLLSRINEIITAGQTKRNPHALSSPAGSSSAHLQ